MSVVVEGPEAGNRLQAARATVDRVVDRARVRRRRVTVLIGLALTTVVLVSLCVGDFAVPLRRIVPVLLGHGDAGSIFIVQSIRLPRILTGVLVGVALGYSGCIFQNVVRNPLASPDILGITAGASLAAVFLITNRSIPFFDIDPQGGLPAILPVAAFIGALGTALLMYGLAFKGGGVSSARLILIGIAVGETLFALTAFMLSRAQLLEAAYGELWLTGSLNARGWESVVPLAIASLVLLPAAHLLANSLRGLQLGEEMSAGIGVRVQWSKFALLIVGVALAGVAVAASGPIAFVAFVAGPIALRLVGGSGPLLLQAGLVGATVVAVADLLGRVALSSTEIPVGIITSLVGVPFLLWLLVQRGRAGIAG
ncbi:MAG TPA: iron chelate uptake ABC transporter family permease subunit [Actinomycetota bacterium]